MHFSSQKEYIRNQILREANHTILEVTKNQINDFTNAFFIDEHSSHNIINIHNHTLRLCHHKQCYQYDLLKLRAMLTKIIPSFIICDIKLNDKTIYTNTTLERYDYHKTHYINDHRYIKVGISLSDNYWFITQKKLLFPYLILVTMLLLLNIASFLLTRYLYYSNNIAKNTDLNHKLWNIQYKLEQELYLNTMFAYRASAVSVQQEQSQHIRIPYFFILQKNKEKSKIDLFKLKSLLIKIFSLEIENAQLQITTKDKYILFESKELLYQVIFSLLKYSLFISQYKYNKSRLCVEVCLSPKEIRFVCSQVVFKSKEDFSHKVDDFFSSHANIFILPPKQVFDVFCKQGFECVVNADNKNTTMVITSKCDAIYKSSDHHAQVIPITGKLK